ncbi:alcohol dehydrogenase catalytic domain-containing protein [Candidatus Contubernalis alkalaceticus]|nr:alcohol dehydrogenase catalytic domain-containing protein [Candidatus Contubernalis alkalaceticus]
MKAAVLEGREKLVIREIETPQCAGGEVLVKLEACGICRTDMKCYLIGQRDLKLPRILGHEIAGTVFAIGEGVKNVVPGSRVQVHPGIFCGECHYCRQGLDNMCDSIKIMGFNYDGGFAEYLRVPLQGVQNGILNEIPLGLSLVEASMTEPLACSLNMQQSLGVQSPDTVLVVGGGRLGILNAKLARLRGAQKIILLEQDLGRLVGAANYEFDYCINPLKTSAEKEIRMLTNGMGVDVAIPCCPGPEAVSISLNVMAKRGRFGFFSGLITEDFSRIDFNLIHYREITAVGAYGCSLEHSRQALQLLGEGAIQVNDMISGILPLEEVEQGICRVKELKGLSLVINFLDS